ncbi:DUF7660 family protein [Cellulomonas soli]|uniref:DUF7660 family protein n=1 Tax=Cellulomonas soli TaxID=931535 RepID=UPI003F84CAAD
MRELSELRGRERLLVALDEMQTELASGARWENDTLARYLEALSALVGSIENDYANTGRDLPSNPWDIITDALRGARYYE